MAQWKRAGPITQRSVDRNYALLSHDILSNGIKEKNLFPECGKEVMAEPMTSPISAEDSALDF